MKILHLSDLHIENEGEIIWDTDTKGNLEMCLQIIKNLKDIDMIIISGDLSNDGSLWSYHYIDQKFAEIGIPTYCCPGNHDNLHMFYDGFSPKFLKTAELLKFEYWSFILLNTAVTGMSRGFLDMGKFQKLLNSCNGNIVIVLHHPPIEQEGWLNRKLLENRTEFNEVITKNGKIKLVLYGHTHYNDIKKINNIIYSSAPSVGFAFSPELAKFEIANGSEGFSIISFYGENIKIENVLLRKKD